MFIFAEKLATAFCDVVIYTSERDIQFAKSFGIYSEHKSRLIRNELPPMDCELTSDLRQELGIPKGFKIVGNVARLDEQKDRIKFLSVAKKVIALFDIRLEWLVIVKVFSFWGFLSLYCL